MMFLSRMLAARTPWLGWWLALALVLSPALQRMHAVLHAPVAITSSAVPAPSADAHHDHGIAAWFDGHEALDCLVLDQLGHGSSDTPTLTLDSHRLPSATPTWYCRTHRQTAPTHSFLARAPPHDFLA